MDRAILKSVADKSGDDWHLPPLYHRAASDGVVRLMADGRGADSTHCKID
jgi:hypothetical protein